MIYLFKQLAVGRVHHANDALPVIKRQKEEMGEKGVTAAKRRKQQKEMGEKGVTAAMRRKQQKEHPALQTRN